MDGNLTQESDTTNLTINVTLPWTKTPPSSSSKFQTMISTLSSDFISTAATTATSEITTNTPTIPPEKKELIIAVSAGLAAFLTGIAMTLICICLYRKVTKARRSEEQTINKNQSSQSKQSLYKSNSNGTLSSHYGPYSVVSLDTGKNMDLNIKSEKHTTTFKDDGYVDMKGKPPTNPDYINTRTECTTTRHPLQKKDCSLSQVYESMDMPYYNIDKDNEKFYIDVLPERDDTGDNDSIYEPYDKSKQPSNHNETEYRSEENYMENKTKHLPNKIGPQVPKKPNKHGRVNDDEDKPNAIKTESIQKTQFQQILNQELNNKLGKLKAKHSEKEEKIKNENNVNAMQMQEETYYVNVNT